MKMAVVPRVGGSIGQSGVRLIAINIGRRCELNRRVGVRVTLKKLVLAFPRGHKLIRKNARQRKLYADS